MASVETLIEAIHRGELASADDEQARRVCGAIGTRVGTEASEIVRVLEAAGVAFTLAGDPAKPAQTHNIDLDVDDGIAAYDVADVLVEHGFDVWEPWTAGARVAHSRMATVLTMARTTDVTITVRCRWAGKRSVPTALRPNRADFAAVTLPSALWPLYFGVRIARLAAEKISIRAPAAPSLGPFLSTPDDLIRPLLDLAEVTSTDLVVDIGCGDGRLVVAASAATGCRARGVEIDAGLVARARQRVSGAGLTASVEIVLADALDVNLDDATVVFVFLPVDVAARLVDEVRTRLAPGARIVVHEQRRLVGVTETSVSIPLMEGQGVTVAHRFDVE